MQIRTADAWQRARSNILLDQAGVRIAAECRAAAAVGGDFYVIAPRRAGRVSVVIGDVCGRGEDGAELLPLVTPTIDELCEAALPPGRLLGELDLRVRKLLPLDRFVTLAAFEVDTRATSVVLANAGHVPTLVRSGDRVRVIGRASGPPLGLARGALYAEENVGLAPGDFLVLMTDGVLEAVESDLVDMTLLRKLVARAPESAVAIHRAIMDELDRRTSTGFVDDSTLLVIEVFGGSGAWELAKRKEASFSCAF